LVLVGIVGCGDDGADGTGGAGGGSGEEAPLVFAPDEAPFGKTHAEWAADWWRSLYEMPPLDGECYLPDDDATGVSCAHGQDPESPVFFLAGTSGGAAVRDECVAPSDKGLFFPMIR